MSQFDGEQCYQELRKIREDVVVILPSGYNEQDLINRFEGKGGAAFIQKPYKLDKLKDRLCTALRSLGPGKKGLPVLNGNPSILTASLVGLIPPVSNLLALC